MSKKVVHASKYLESGLKRYEGFCFFQKKKTFIKMFVDSFLFTL